MTEASLDDETRQRIWAKVLATTDARPDQAFFGEPAPAEQAYDRTDTEHGIDAPRRRRAIARSVPVAAAAVVAVSLAWLIPRAATTEDRPTESLAAATTDGSIALDDLADVISQQPGPVLGDPGATYVHLTVRATQNVDGLIRPALSPYTTETWTAADGSGRQAGTAVPPGGLRMGGLTPAEVLSLPDDGPAVHDVLSVSLGPDATRPNILIELVEILAHAGLPAPARAGLLRALGTFAPSGSISPSGEVELELAIGTQAFLITLDASTGTVVGLHQNWPNFGRSGARYSSALTANTR